MGVRGSLGRPLDCPVFRFLQEPGFLPKTIIQTHKTCGSDGGLGCRCSSISPAFSGKYSIHLRDIILQCFGVYFKRLVTFDVAYSVCFVCLFAELLNAFGRGFLRGFWRIFGWDLARLFRSFSSVFVCIPQGFCVLFYGPASISSRSITRPSTFALSPGTSRFCSKSFTSRPCSESFALMRPSRFCSKSFTPRHFTVLLQVFRALATFVSQSRVRHVAVLLQALHAAVPYPAHIEKTQAVSRLGVVPGNDIFSRAVAS